MILESIWLSNQKIPVSSSCSIQTTTSETSPNVNYRWILIFKQFIRFFSLLLSRTYLVEKYGPLHIYYANKPFKHWKKRWLHLQDQQLSIYQGKIYR